MGTMTINEWKQEFAKLYVKMKEDIGTEKLEILIKEDFSLRCENGTEISRISTYVKIDDWYDKT